jgi:predicted PurR-regulated permease PerM
VRYFGLRTSLNALTGLGVAVDLFLLGIDFAPSWGVLLFFLSYVSYVPYGEPVSRP